MNRSYGNVLPFERAMLMQHYRSKSLLGASPISNIAPISLMPPSIVGLSQTLVLSNKIGQRPILAITSTKNCCQGVPPELSGFVSAYNLVIPGSSPKHTMNAFIFIVNLCYICHVKTTKINKKRPDLAHF